MNLRFRNADSDDPEFCYDCNSQATRILDLKSGRVGFCDPCISQLILQLKDIPAIALAGGVLQGQTN